MVETNHNPKIDAYWARYRDLYGFERTLSRYRERKAVEFIETLNLPSVRILEIGCGYLPIYKSLTSFGTYLGIEPGKAPFDTIASESANDDRVVMKHGYFSDFSSELKGSDFDVVVSIGVMQDIPKPENFLREISAVMRSETFAYINVPNANSLHRIIGLYSGHLESMENMSARQIALEAQNLFTEATLVNTITSTLKNAKIRNSGSFFIKPFTHSQMEKMLSSDILDEEVMEGLYLCSNDVAEIGAELFVIFQLEPDGSNP